MSVTVRDWPFSACSSSFKGAFWKVRVLPPFFCRQVPDDAAGQTGKAIVFLGTERADLFLPPGNDGQGRGLDPSAGKLGIVLAGEGPGGVDPHQPVCFSPASCRVIERIVLAALLYVGESLPDGLVGNGRDPEPFDGFYGSRNGPGSSGPPVLLLFPRQWR